MSSKKYKLKDLKVKSFVSKMESGDQKTSKGGFYFIENFQRLDIRNGNNWTEHKTQLFESRPQIIQITRPNTGPKKS